MIKDLLPHYYAAHGMNPTFKNVRSIIIDGHEVAWMEYRGTVTYDITGEGRAGQPYLGRKLYCECHFTEGVGWEKDATHGVVGLMGPDCCVRRKTAMHLRRLELQSKYLTRFAPGSSDPYSLVEYSKNIVLDLIERAKAGEFIGETGEGASFWGGYFYFQTVESIMGGYFDPEVIPSLMSEKIISLNGGIVSPYREPLPPQWHEYLSIEDGQFRGRASLPTHEDMPQTWLLEVFMGDRLLTGKHPHELPLTHSRYFGPDTSDVAHAETYLRRLIADAKEQERIESKYRK
ncbi:hypothetical protein FJY93_05245 [Candidatus Kaiserbacteria bacterium]|nr:hypothetical protein [Candidatus Kaiserbacteria bacterium]